MSNVKCQRAGCGGDIVDGICEDCGRAPQGGTLLPAEILNDTGAPSTVVSARASSMKVSSSKVRGTFSYPMSRSKLTQSAGRAGTRRHTSRSSKTSSRKRALGGGLVSLPPMPSQDPLKLLMAKAEVPLNKRSCPACGHKLKLVKGFCPNNGCGQPYDFRASLNAGDLVAGQYEIKGAIAYGGLGWVYLGWDQQLTRWVILKGLLNAKDESSAAAALAERRFLAAFNFGKIVKIFNFVTHGGEGFMVLEFVDGLTIEEVRKAHDTVDVFDENGTRIKSGVLRSDLSPIEKKATVKVTKYGVLPVEEAIAYILGILPAFSYVHTNGGVYCDFKPGNFMAVDDDVKLIDMGAVRKIGDPNGDIFGTTGYMAPEASDDPREVSDLYTVGRTLATLIMDFPYTRQYENALPTPDEQPVLAENEALYRFLLRSTHPDPDERFQTADEMFDQLFGVLREIVALKTGPKAAESKAFSSDNLLQADDDAGVQSPLARLLPTIKVAPEDKAANDILRLAAVTQVDKRIEALKQLVTKFGDKSAEAPLRLADTLISAARLEEAGEILDKLEQEDPYDWRVQWERGLLHLTAKDAQAAYTAFEKVYFEMPGELAPKLAMGFAAELGDDKEIAGSFYNRVSSVDPNQVSACFGLARCLVERGDVVGAVGALNRVPASHSLSTQAHVAVARVLLNSEDKLDGPLLKQAEEAISLIGQDNGVVHQLAAKLLGTALRFMSKGTLQAGYTVLGHPLEARALRRAAEREYLNAAQYARDAAERIFWVDLANKIRPVTLW
jgi:serine/threonine-protein kinase PknG